MIIIKKYIKYVGIFILCLLSFYYTEKVALYVKNKNPVFQKIKEAKETIFVDYINSTIIDNLYIIPGISGKEINIDRSFSNMTEYNKYLEEHLVFNTIKPKISIEDNKDKIIIQGNREKQSISLIFENDNNLSKYLQEKNYKVNILIDETPSINKNYEYINNSNQQSTYSDIEFYLNKNNINKKLCYIKEDNIIPSLCKNKYLFKPSLTISHSNISSTLNQITSGDILLIKDSISLTELKVILNQINYRNLNIISLSEHIKE